MRRVVVTGMGIVSSIGNNTQEVLASLREARSGIVRAEDYERLGFRCQVHGAPTLNPEEVVDRRAMRFHGGGTAWNHVAMDQAIRDAGLEEGDISNERTGIIMGSGGPSTRVVVESAEIARTKGPKRVGPFAVPKAMSSTASATLATWFKIKGVNYSISSACATSNHCIGNAYEMIQYGKQDVMFAGGCEELDWTLSVLFDAMGAELNAGTDKEGTTVYARMLDQHMQRAFDVMADMVWRPAFNDVDPEREVVLEEIAMYEDDPQDTVFDVLGTSIFGDHPLGRPIIGRAPVIRETPVDQIAAFHARRYVPSSVVIAAAGSVDHDAIVALAERTLHGLRAGESAPQPDPAPQLPQSRLRFQTKETEQVHVCLGGPGLSRADERRYAVRVLDAIFGGLSSSRLFQSVREERGLAYAVYSFAGNFVDTGQVGLYVGTRPDNLAEAMQVVEAELRRLREQPVSAEELDRARENVKARVVLAMESSAARMNRLGSATLYGLPLLEADEIMARFDAVTIDDLQSLVAELWAPERLSAAGIGPSQEAFRAAVEPVCPVAEAVAA